MKCSVFKILNQHRMYSPILSVLKYSCTMYLAWHSLMQIPFNLASSQTASYHLSRHLENGARWTETMWYVVMPAGTIWCNFTACILRTRGEWAWYLHLPWPAYCCTPWTRGRRLVKPRASAALLKRLQLLCYRGLWTTWCLYLHWKIYKKQRKFFIWMVRTR